MVFRTKYTYILFVCLLLFILASYLTSEAEAAPRRGGGGRSRSFGSRGSSRSRSVKSAKGGTRTVFSRRGKFGKGGKDFGGFKPSDWKKALLAGLAAGFVLRGRGPNNIIVFHGAQEYLHSDRGRRNQAPTVCYNDVRKDDNGTTLYYFLCPKNDTTKDEEYCCDKNDKENEQYCCTAQEWSKAPGIVAQATSVFLVISLAFLIS